MHPQRRIPLTVFILPVVFAIFWLLLTHPAFAATGPSWAGQPATPQPPLTNTSLAVAPVSAQPADGSPADWHVYCPSGPADALGDPAFWIVMGLVVLGYFVVGAEFRQNS